MEENIKEAMAAAHDNMQEKMQEKVDRGKKQRWIVWRERAGQTGSR